MDRRVLEFFDITATVNASFPVDCSDFVSSSLLVKSFNRGPQSPSLAVTIVCHDLLSYLLLYFLWGLVSFLHSCSKTSRATAFDFYDGFFVFWIK